MFSLRITQGPAAYGCRKIWEHSNVPYSMGSGTEENETWSWFIDHLKTDLCMGEGLGWSLVSDMQKVCKTM